MYFTLLVWTVWPSQKITMCHFSTCVCRLVNPSRVDPTMVHSTNMMQCKSEVVQFDLQLVREWMYSGRTIGVLGGVVKITHDAFAGNDSTVMLVTLTGFTATKLSISSDCLWNSWTWRTLCRIVSWIDFGAVEYVLMGGCWAVSWAGGLSWSRGLEKFVPSKWDQLTTWIQSITRVRVNTVILLRTSLHRSPINTRSERKDNIPTLGKK